MPEATKAGALVVDPRPLFRDAICICLHRGGYVALSQAENPQEAVEQVALLQPNLLIVGPHIAESGLAVCR